MNDAPAPPSPPARPRVDAVAWVERLGAALAPFRGALLVVVVFGGLLLRWLALGRLGPQIDESASVLAARMVAEKGFPLFPSGVLYLQGATLSYLAQPLLSPDRVGIAEVHALRVISLVAGTLFIPVAARLGTALSGRGWIGFLTGVLVAVDPLCVEWSAHVRPYALLQLLTAGMLTLWAESLDTRSPRRMAALVAVFWVGLFTHVGIGLVWPPLVVVSVIGFGRRLWTDRRDLGAALIACLGAPVVFLGINRAWKVTSSGDGTAGASFVGDHLLDPARILAPDIDSWRDLFTRSSADELLMPTIAAACGILVGRTLSERTPDPRFLGAMAAYWFPIGLIGFFTSDAQNRYLLHVHVLTWVLLLWGMWSLAGPAGPWRWVRGVFAGTGLGFAVAHVSDGVYVRLHVEPEVDPDYQAALAWVLAEKRPEQVVISGMTPVAWLAPVPADQLYFLAGDIDGPRARRYTRGQPDGSRQDYWVGVPSITTAAGLCAVLAAHPGAWIVVDKTRLRAGWAFNGPIAEVIRGAAERRFSPDEDALVYQSRPAGAWAFGTSAACSRTKGAGADEGDEEPSAGP